MSDNKSGLKRKILNKNRFFLGYSNTLQNSFEPYTLTPLLYLKKPKRKKFRSPEAEVDVGGDMFWTILSHSFLSSSDSTIRPDLDKKASMDSADQDGGRTGGSGGGDRRARRGGRTGAGAIPDSKVKWPSSFGAPPAAPS